MRTVTYSKLKHAIRVGALALTLMAAGTFDVQAGIPLGQLPTKGALVYIQLADGTYVPMSGSPGGVTQLGYQQVTSLSASTALPSIPAGATYALIIPETQAVRWRGDGSTTAPTATVGMPLPVGTPLIYAGDLTAIRFIEQSASAKLDITYFK